MEETAHWTARNIEAFIQRITFDFIAQLEQRLGALPMNQAELAQKLEVSEGAVSQILNNPPNLTLKTIVKYARALGLKVAIVAYDDNDPNNDEGPVGSEIFSSCWERANKPRDHWSLEKLTTPTKNALSEDYVVISAGSHAHIFPKSAITANAKNISATELENMLTDPLESPTVSQGLLKLQNIPVAV